MPTVHLALPEILYNELKKRASDMGIQITDLIKLYIRLGLDGALSQPPKVEDEVLTSLSLKVDKLEKEFKLKSTMLEGKIREFEETIKFVIERLESLEEAVVTGRYGGIVQKRIPQSHLRSET
ncbi:MAG: hypothetical protein QXN05_01975 [Acidilobaceae archaeon]